jgi:BolA family transcriptional regulator, general stress-responsive regulator
MMMESLCFNHLNEKNMSEEYELGPVGQQITKKLNAAFAPHALSLIDESNQHHGHAGAHPSGESHFRLKITAEAFRGRSRVECHRMVNSALAEELKSRVHALAMECAAPATTM